MRTSPDPLAPLLQDRDFRVLRDLFESRLTTLTHAASIHFDGSREAAKKRFQKLKSAGLIGERSRKAYEPSILFLTRSGFDLLRARGIAEDFPQLTSEALERRIQVSDQTLRHELQILDVKASLYTAIRAEARYHIEEFSSWPLRFQFKASPGAGPEAVVKPDGFIRIHEQDAEGVYEHTFYLEVDRSTETLDTLVRKALSYLDYYQRGGLAARAGRPRSEYKDFPFRVLMILKTTERRNNVAEQLLLSRPPIYTQVWLTTMQEMKALPLAPIWIRPKDYRDVSKGSEFDINGASGPNRYRRQSFREAFIEAGIRKHELFSNDVGDPIKKSDR